MATLGLRGPSCPTWATADVMAVSEYICPSSPMAIPSWPGSVGRIASTFNLLLLSAGASPAEACSSQ